jgi:beta-lactamase class A
LQLHQLSFRVSRWYRKHQRFIRQIGIGLAAFSVFVVLAQLAYPAGRILPFVAVESLNVHGATTIQATKQLDARYSKAKLTVKTQDKSFTRSYDEAGLDPDSWNTARSAARYTFAQRLIPFSSVYIMLRRDTPMQVKVDDDRLKYFTQEVQKEGFIAAVNADVTVSGSEVKLVPAKQSKEYPAQTVEASIRKAAFKPQTDVAVAPRNNWPERTDDEVKSVLGDAQRAVNTPLSLKVGEEKIKVEKPTIGTWLDFVEEPSTKKLQLVLKTDTVTKYLDGIQGKVYKEPGTTHIQIIDGHEAGRTEGAPGQGIDTPKAIASLNDILRKGQETILTVPVAALPAKVVYDKQYSNTDAGLTAMLADLAKTKGFGVSVMEINGRIANANGNKSFTAASTYKLFVAYAVFKQIEAGQMAWGDAVNGQTVANCFDAMIVKSDNPCGKALGDRIGWQNIEDMMHGLGLTNTQLSPQLTTTANDLALYLYKLQNGSLVSAPDQARLLDAMKRQIYRSGIPAGTGLPVADKVGFVDDVIHDAGIVYGARGPYVMVIMTSNSSWSDIAAAAKQINTFLNR